MDTVNVDAKLIKKLYKRMNEIDQKLDEIRYAVLDTEEINKQEMELIKKRLREMKEDGAVRLTKEILEEL